MSQFVVEFTDRATDEFNAICDWYEKQSLRAAEKWLDAVERMLEELEQNPQRFPRASDSQVSYLNFLECTFGAGNRRTHRMVFHVCSDGRVIVYAIRHLARDELTAEDL